MSRPQWKLPNRALMTLLLFSLALTAGVAVRAGMFTQHREGTIENIEKQDQKIFAKVSLNEPNTENEILAVGSAPLQVQIAMGVKLEIQLGTSFFRMPLGRVLSVSKDGKTCVVEVIPTYLEQTVQNPTNQTTYKVGHFFEVGATVSIGRESL